MASSVPKTIEVPRLGQARIVAVRAGQRTGLHRVVAHERRRDERVLHELLEQFQDDLPGAPRLLDLDVELGGELAEVFEARCRRSPSDPTASDTAA